MPAIEMTFSRPSGKFTWPMVIAPRIDRVTKICFKIA
jgi:hypothetical protein